MLQQNSNIQISDENLTSYQPEAEENESLSSILEESVAGSSCASSSSYLVKHTVEHLLAEAVKEYRCIWDMSSKSLKETPKEQQAWREIAGKLGEEGSFFFVLL